MLYLRTIILILGLGFILTVSSFYSGLKTSQFDVSNKNVADVLLDLGDKKPHHFIESLKADLVEKGKQIVTEGITTESNGKKTKFQSRHFKCTSCHNIAKEDPNLSINDPEARLEYARKNNLPFLPGTTLYGTVNRSKWYNGDYYKKYGDLVLPARDTLINAIQLCATECSKGRALTKWEINAVVQYLWSLQLKFSDLNLTDKEFNILEDSSLDNEEKITLIKSKYLNKSDATFLEPIPFGERKFGKEGDSEIGKELIKRSCVHCHSPQKEISKYKIDINNSLKIKQLLKNAKKASDQSIYEVSRKGFYPVGSRQAYMPHYSKQRLSDKQIEDMVAFLRQIKKEKNSANID